MSSSSALLLLLVAGLAVLSPVMAINEPLCEASAAGFELWKSHYGVNYSTAAEHNVRLQVWLANHATVQQHNAAAMRPGGPSFFLGMNRFADLTNAEFRTRLGLRAGGRRLPLPGSNNNRPLFRDAESQDPLPDSVDWRTKGVVTPIKDQGQCGSCWAFSAVAAMEGAFNWAHRNATMPTVCQGTLCSAEGPDTKPCCSFSEQEIVDCTLGGADTCNKGGEMHDGIMEVINGLNNTINTEKQYPYQARSGRCRPKADPVAVNFKGYTNVTSGDEQALAVAAATYPIISVGIDASSMDFQLYSSGVFNNPKCKNSWDALDHGVAVVGYGAMPPPPPTPPPSPPGPRSCMKDFHKEQCEAEKGCHWCVDSHGFGYCFNEPCPSTAAAAAAMSAAPQAANLVSPPSAAMLDYWIVRNSWSSTWGLNGYILMSRNKDNQCGIATDAVYVDM